MQISTDPHPLISCGKGEKDILIYLYNHSDIFDKTKHWRQTGVPRSTIGSRIDSLIIKGLLIKNHIGSYTVTTLGESLIKLRSGKKTSDESSRWGCRERETLSLHDITFKVNILEKKVVSRDELKQLMPLDIQETDMIHWMQYRLYFDDAIISINTKQIVLNIKELLGNDLDDSQFNAISKALKYIKKLTEFGFKLDTLRLDLVHYARINSFLAESLPYTEKGYKFDFDDGSSFWIDNSNDQVEDETNEPKIRKRIDEWVKDAIKSKSLMSDLDKLKEIVAEIAKIQAKQIVLQNKDKEKFKKKYKKNKW